MQTLQALLEQDREKFQSRVSGKDRMTAAEEARAELDRILLAYNDGEENEEVRSAANALIQTVKASVSLIDSEGVTRIYSQTDYGEGGSIPNVDTKGRVPWWFTAFLVLSVVAAAFLYLIFYRHTGELDLPYAQYVRWGLPGLTAVLWFLAGCSLRRRKPKLKVPESLHAETQVDSSKVYNRLLSVLIVADRQLEAVRGAQELKAVRQEQESAQALDPSQLELLSQLLEEAYGRADEGAQETCSHIKYYLHQNRVEAVDYTPSADALWFDLMPGAENATLRPALVSDGVLLKKGLAAGGR